MRAFELNSVITFSLVISVLILNGCSPAMLMAGGSHSRATKEEKIAWKAARERNAAHLQRMIEKYDPQALAGDPSAQLNMARVWHDQYRIHINDYAFQKPPFKPNFDEKVQKNAKPLLDKSDEYLNKAIAAGFPPAMTYSVCRGGKLENNRGRPETAADLAMLKQAAALGEPHAQYLLAMYDYWNASNKDQRMLPPAITQLLLDASEGGILRQRKISTLGSRARGLERSPESTCQKTDSRKLSKDMKKAPPWNIFKQAQIMCARTIFINSVQTNWHNNSHRRVAAKGFRI
ncbi:hypothetical protein [Burkholderia ubonensis]|uniref:hypothetical protein n=1 Tax=Burkholderia ubonensis TaxID=101571 RepID=UPI000AB12E89|nr:hypothetical protein [Burkholderia ubonensis]